MARIIRTGGMNRRPRSTGGVVVRDKRKVRPEDTGKKQVVAGSQTASLLANLQRPEPKNLAELARMMRNDYQIQLAERVLSSNILSADVSVSVEYADQTRKEDDRTKLLKDHNKKLWDKTIKSLMMSVGDGRVAYEKVWAYNDTANITFIEALQDLPFEQTEMILHSQEEGDLEEDWGKFKGIHLKAKGEELELDPNKSWWFALDATPLEPHGRSRYVGAPYETWKDRQELKRLRTLFIRRFCIGGGVAHVPESVINEEGEVVDVFEATAQAYDILSSGGLMLLPNDREATTNGPGAYLYDFDGAQIQVRDASPLQSLIEMLDSEQLLAFGIPPKTVIEGDAVGSFAMVTQQMLILFSVIEDLLDQYIESFNLYVVAKQTEANYPEDDAPIIKLIYNKLTERPDDLVVQLVQGWLTNSQLSDFVKSGTVDVHAIFERVGIPLSDDAEARVKQVLMNAQNAPPPGSPEGSPEGLPGQPPADPSTAPPNGPPGAAQGPESGIPGDGGGDEGLDELLAALTGGGGQSGQSRQLGINGTNGTHVRDLEEERAPFRNRLIK